MGNPAWGHGYHQGSADGYRLGFDAGAKQGSVITAAVAVGVGALIGGAAWGYDQIKKARVAKHEQRLAVQAELLDHAEDAPGEDEPPALPSES